MTVRVECKPAKGGLEVTRVSGTEKLIDVPARMDGTPVVSLGPRFLAQCPGGSGRTLRIPSTVVRASPEAMEGSSGIALIEYDGELDSFCGLKLVSYQDCEVSCLHDGKGFRFTFLANTPMSFPEFDEAVLGSFLGLTPEMAISRLSNPVGLTEESRERYVRFARDRIMPGAEQAVADGDVRRLRQLASTGLLTDDDMRRLLERSLRSGRIPITSMLMSEMRARALNRS